MKFVFLGDVHGDLARCVDVCKANQDATIIQVGDLGVGFDIPLDVFLGLPENFRFFPGNHDCRDLCRLLPHCLSDYGEAYGKFFFVSGAESIDKTNRIEGKSWWRNEELTYEQASDCLDKWASSKLDILVSHDCPQSFVEGYKLIYDRCLTRNLLQRMIEVREPRLVIYGHHHRSKFIEFNRIMVKELGIGESFTIDI